MGYMKAEEILPEEIIELIQQYADGVNLYIPRKQNHRQEWGAGTAYKGELQKRNKLIYHDFVSGTPIDELAKNYFLSEKSIQRIIRQKKAEKVS